MFFLTLRISALTMVSFLSVLEPGYDNSPIKVNGKTPNGVQMKKVLANTEWKGLSRRLRDGKVIELYKRNFIF